MEIQIPWRPLGSLLVEKGVITEVELEHALELQSATGKRLGEILVERGVISGPALTVALAEQWGIEVSPEGGFGSGLWQKIERRHRDRRETDTSVLTTVEPLGGEPPTEPLEPEPHDADLLREELAVVTAELEGLRASYEETLRQLDELRRGAAARQAVGGHLLFVQRDQRYAILDGEGAAPPVGADLEVEGAPYRVWKLGRSPLPDDPRLCAFALPHTQEHEGR